MKTPPKAALLYEAAYSRYVAGGYLLKLKDFCLQEGIYFQGFQEWVQEKEYSLSVDCCWTGQVGKIFKIDLL